MTPNAITRSLILKTSLALLGAGLLGLIFAAYQSPAMSLSLSSLPFC